MTKSTKKYLNAKKLISGVISRDGIIFSYSLNMTKSPVSPSKFVLNLKEYMDGFLK